MSDSEIKSWHHKEYDYFKKLLEIFKLKHPESYPLVAAEMGEDFREYIKRSGGIDSLPPLP